MEIKPTSFASALNLPKPNTDTTELCARFPHIDKILQLWGSSTCREALNGLLHDNRDGGRAGFPPEFAKIIFALLVEHDESYPQFNKTNVAFSFNGR